jgi:hypothetical protein
MDDRDFLAINEQIKKDVQITHPSKVVSFAYIDSDTRDLYTYFFMFENGTMKLHSIDKWVKNGKSGNTYKHEEIFHFEYKKTITNYETGEFEEPKIPVDVWENASNCLTGYLVNCL